MHPCLRSISRTRFAKLLLLPISAMLLSACGDPAPEEGMEKPPMKGPAPVVVGAKEAVQLPDIPTIDPQTLDEAEVRKVLGAGPYCSFAYTAESSPITAFGDPGQGAAAGKGMVKIHGRLVELSAQRAEAGTIGLIAEGMKLDINIVEPSGQDDMNATERREADMHFELEQGLRVGYRGWYSCTDARR